jgi:hypothetical protein
MEKSYHRRWHRGNGKHCAMMRLREFVPTDVGPVTEPQDVVTLFGSPAFVYLDLVRYSYLWAGAVCRRDDPMFYANQLRHVWSYVKTRYRLFRADKSRSVPIELVTFVRSYIRKHLNRTPKPASA